MRPTWRRSLGRSEPRVIVLFARPLSASPVNNAAVGPAMLTFTVTCGNARSGQTEPRDDKRVRASDRAGVLHFSGARHAEC